MDTKKIWCLLLVGLSITSIADAGISGGVKNAICVTGCGTMAINCYAGTGFVVIAFTGKVKSTTPALQMCNDAYDFCKSTCKKTASYMLKSKENPEQNN